MVVVGALGVTEPVVMDVARAGGSHMELWQGAVAWVWGAHRPMWPQFAAPAAVSRDYFGAVFRARCVPLAPNEGVPGKGPSSGRRRSHSEPLENQSPGPSAQGDYKD